ncbi:putative U3 small nucleolar RNA-associated protein 7 [Smittium culicis]|uniref:Putative U3 small nucleolar RNA-associated protein 7 n=1 Tax=Smittium culicis TaxID=133412 RepID=A0A1R1YN07_9FUNG|nr:putative U3 small nucleolar RNA-associated protein 7 [Smittium culicis]
MLLGGRKGHIASIDWKGTKIVTEFNVKETIRDVTCAEEVCVHIRQIRRRGALFEKNDRDASDELFALPLFAYIYREPGGSEVPGHVDGIDSFRDQDKAGPVRPAAQLLHGETRELHGHQSAGRFGGGHGPDHNGVEGRAEAEGEEPVPLAPDALAAIEHAAVCSKQRREGEVIGLLDKVSHELICLDPAVVGTVDTTRMSSADKIDLEKKKLQAKLKRSTASGRNEQQAADNADGDSDPSASASASFNGDDGELRKRARGRNSSAKRKLRKTQKNVIDLKKLSALNQVGKQEKIAKIKDAFAESSGYELDGPLSKFYKEKINREFS